MNFCTKLSIVFLYVFLSIVFSLHAIWGSCILYYNRGSIDMCLTLWWYDVLAVVYSSLSASYFICFAVYNMFNMCLYSCCMLPANNKRAFQMYIIYIICALSLLIWGTVVNTYPNKWNCFNSYIHNKDDQEHFDDIYHDHTSDNYYSVLTLFHISYYGTIFLYFSLTVSVILSYTGLLSHYQCLNALCSESAHAITYDSVI